MSEADGYVELFGENRAFHGHPKNSGFRTRGKHNDSTKEKKKDVLFSICACHPCAGAML